MDLSYILLWAVPFAIIGGLISLIGPQSTGRYGKAIDFLMGALLGGILGWVMSYAAVMVIWSMSI